MSSPSCPGISSWKKLSTHVGRGPMAVQVWKKKPDNWPKVSKDPEEQPCISDLTTSLMCCLSEVPPTSFLSTCASLPVSSSFFKKNNNCIYLWQCWIFTAAWGLSLVVASGGYSLLWCAGFSLWRLLLLRSTGCRHSGFSSCGTHSVVAVCGL